MKILHLKEHEIEMLSKSVKNSGILHATRNEVEQLIDKIMLIKYAKGGPVFNYPENKPTLPGLYLCMFSKNTEDPDLTMEGPCIGPLIYAHTVYQGNVHLKFVNPEDAIKFGIEDEDMLTIDDGLIKWNGKAYSDWTVANFPIQDSNF